LILRGEKREKGKGGRKRASSSSSVRREKWWPFFPLLKGGGGGKKKESFLVNSYGRGGGGCGNGVLDGGLRDGTRWKGALTFPKPVGGGKKMRFASK